MNTETQIPENETIAQKAYRLLYPIPAEQWCTNMYSNGKNSYCAIGHLNRLNALNPNDYPIDISIRGWGYNSSLSAAIKMFFEKQHNIKESFDLLASVNDAKDIAIYTEETPKDRVMHLLTDMIAAGF
jgi:hypothetical protein